MGVFANLGHALVGAAGSPPALPVRVAVADPNGGPDIVGVVTRELSETHVRLSADDGLAFAVPKADLRLVPAAGGAP